jgi:enoyl-CoA hydratase/carnithine racemase
MVLTDRRALMDEPVRFEIQDGVAVVTLDIPGEKVNLLNAGLLGALESTARDLASRQPTSSITTA